MRHAQFTFNSKANIFYQMQTNSPPNFRPIYASSRSFRYIHFSQLIVYNIIIFFFWTLSIVKIPCIECVEFNILNIWKNSQCSMSWSISQVYRRYYGDPSFFMNVVVKTNGEFEFRTYYNHFFYIKQLNNDS